MSRPIISPSLSYVLGVIDGDGYVCLERKSRNFKVGLNTRDREFAEAFQMALKNIGLKANIYFNKSSKMWIVYAYSKPFYSWYRSLTVEEKRKLIQRFPVDYLRGLYDSDGSFYMCKSRKNRYPRVMIYNSNIGLLNFARELLAKLGMKSYIHIVHKKGFKSIINGKVAETKRDIYCLTLSLSDTRKFISIIKPSIPRKRGET